MNIPSAAHPPVERTTACARPAVCSARRIVVKLGTRVLTHANGHLALARLFSVVEEVGRLRDAGREVIMVSSGAVGLGRAALGMTQTPAELAERQACAAVGQTRLMGLYEAGFSRLGVVTGQVLLTESDFDDRVRYLNVRNTLLTLLQKGVVPIINENDAVSVEELAWRECAEDARPVFGDNDRLSALVATRLDADLLVLLTDVDGLYDRDPQANAGATLVSVVDADDANDSGVQAGESTSGAGRGGMRSKLEAAVIAARSGCHAVIASGRRADALARVMAGDTEGTWVPAKPGIPARHRWIAWAAAPRGALHLDQGAVRALRERGASLLAAGVQRVEGRFRPGEVVELRAPNGQRVGRGIIGCDADVARKWCAGERPPYARNHHALVHRDQQVLDPHQEKP
ncbi:MAG: glutamate 5-kinase [Polyangiaceae bacterium]|nr:glutamate 5-kinase [Polyangiaceae bacterium]